MYICLYSHASHVDAVCPQQEILCLDLQKIVIIEHKPGKATNPEPRGSRGRGSGEWRSVHQRAACWFSFRVRPATVAPFRSMPFAAAFLALPASLLLHSSNRFPKLQSCDCRWSRASWPSDEVSLREVFSIFFFFYFVADGG